MKIPINGLESHLNVYENLFIFICFKNNFLKFIYIYIYLSILLMRKHSSFASKLSLIFKQREESIIEEQNLGKSTCSD